MFIVTSSNRYKMLDHDQKVHNRSCYNSQQEQPY